MLHWESYRSVSSCPDYQLVEFFFRRVSSTIFAMSPQEQGIIFGIASQAHVSIQFEDRQGAKASKRLMCSAVGLEVDLRVGMC